jgi:hypothetical protein
MTPEQAATGIVLAVVLVVTGGAGIVHTILSWWSGDH